MAKRARDVFDTPSSSSPPMPPSKRQSMSAPAPPTFRSTFPIPRSPWAFSVPHDSPSNPFGLDRALRALALPRPSGFGKHIVLRMQLVSQIESRPRSRRAAPEAPYRVVQVPLNYSFRLLHELILFLFASDSCLRVRRPRRVFDPTSLYPRQPPALPRKPKSALEVFGESPKKEDGHLFEVLNDVSVYASTYRPGVIKPGSGKLYARLSSTRERKLFRDDHPDDDDDDVFGGTSAKPVSVDDEEEWDWEAEDDFLVGNVWTDGPDLKKGIIYHHTPSTAIHITVNHLRVPPRKGTGNTPYIFSALGGAHGAVRIANIVSGPMPSEEEIKENMEVKSSGPRRKSKSKSAKETGPSTTLKALLGSMEDEYDEVDDLDDGEVADENQLQRWNAHDAFSRFLAREAARERAMRRTAELERDVLQSPAPATRANMLLPASPAASGSISTSASKSSSSAHIYASRDPQPSYYAHPGAASSSTSLSAAPSSPSTLPVLLPSSDFDGDAETWSDLDFDTDPNPSSEADGVSSSASSVRSLARRHVYEIELPLQTPYPADAAARRRVGRMCKRIERQTSKGLSEMSDEEDEEEQKDELISSQESKASEEVEGEATQKEAARTEEDEVTAKQPVVAARGPDLFEGVYDTYEPAPLVQDDDSDDEGWETGQIEFVVEDTVEDDWDDDW